MIIETQVPLQAHNTFGIAAKAERLLRLRSMEDVAALLADPIRLEPHFVLGGGSNISMDTLTDRQHFLPLHLETQ